MTSRCALICFPDGDGQCFAWGCFVWQDRCGANPAGCRWEVGSALLYTACQGWDCLSPASPEGGSFCWLHLNPVYVCSADWLEVCELLLNSWIKWLWMKNIGCAFLGALGVLEFDLWSWLKKCSFFWSTWCAFLGIDVNIKDNHGLTALDTVRELPSQKSQQIAALIEGISPSHCPSDGGPSNQTKAFVVGTAFFLLLFFNLSI